MIWITPRSQIFDSDRIACFRSVLSPVLANNIAADHEFYDRVVVDLVARAEPADVFDHVEPHLFQVLAVVVRRREIERVLVAGAVHLGPAQAGPRRPPGKRPGQERHGMPLPRQALRITV